MELDFRVLAPTSIYSYNLTVDLYLYFQVAVSMDLESVMDISEVSARPPSWSDPPRWEVSSRYSSTSPWSGSRLDSSSRRVFRTLVPKLTSPLVQNLKADVNLNNFLPSETSDIWVPELLFENTVSLLKPQSFTDK